MNPQFISKKLVALRGKKSREEVSKAVEISCSALAMYENAQRIPRDEIKERIAAYYNTDVGAIFYAN